MRANLWPFTTPPGREHVWLPCLVRRTTTNQVLCSVGVTGLARSAASISSSILLLVAGRVCTKRINKISGRRLIYDYSVREGVKLPGLLSVAGRFEPITVLESVLRGSDALDCFHQEYTEFLCSPNELLTPRPNEQLRSSSGWSLFCFLTKCSIRPGLELLCL